MNTHTPMDRTERDLVHPARHTDREAEGPRVVTSEALFHGRREIGIEHAGAVYKLKITRQGKLILNK